VPKIYLKRLKVEANAIDIHGHVNNQEYLRWMEEIAIEHSSAQGWPMERYLKSGISWYVRSHFIEYLRPALLDEEISVFTWIAGMGERESRRCTLFLRNGSRHKILSRAETHWTFVDVQRGRAIPIPEEVRSAFEIVTSENGVLQEASRLLRDAG
jgi:acyl-CoA thioester hydrolase